VKKMAASGQLATPKKMVVELEVEQRRKDITTPTEISRTIVVPLDGTKKAESVLLHVEALAKQEGAELVDIVLVRVCQTPVISADYPEAAMPLSWEKHVENEITKHRRIGERYLAEIERRLKDAGLRVRSEVLLGNPAEEIIKYVNGNPCNLVAMATHRRSRFIRWLYGSVAEKILRRAQSPIYLVSV
jgi:nucleotide-binding universal stress UspA family protein